MVSTKRTRSSNSSKGRCVTVTVLLLPFVILTIVGGLFLRRSVFYDASSENSNSTEPLARSNQSNVPTVASPNANAVVPSSSVSAAPLGTPSQNPTRKTPSPTSAPTNSPIQETLKPAATTSRPVATPMPSITKTLTGSPTQTPSGSKSTDTYPPLPTAVHVQTGIPFPPIERSSILDYLSFRPTATVTLSPTKAPIKDIDFDEGLRFRLKLHWEPHYFWQEEEEETWWCVACTRCEELNFGARGKGCSMVNKCREGDQIWLQPCKTRGINNGEVFSFADVGDFQQIKISGTNFCLERKFRRYVTAEQCEDPDSGVSLQQLWFGMRDDGLPFEIRPAAEDGDDEPFCLTQQHHPKNYEICGLKECELAHKYDTGFWTQYKLSN